MEIRDYKKALIDSMRMEQEYHDFCEECLKYIYKGDEEAIRIALSEFQVNVDSYNYNGCIQGLENVMRCTKEVVDDNKKREKESAERYRRAREETPELCN